MLKRPLSYILTSVLFYLFSRVNGHLPGGVESQLNVFLLSLIFCAFHQEVLSCPHVFSSTLSELPRHRDESLIYPLASQIPSLFVFVIVPRFQRASVY